MAAVDDVLTDPSYAEAARCLARAIAAAPGVTGAVQILERVVLDRPTLGLDAEP
jgi:UDP:flavonoid glycosyltransferase YjiC (YdhE family)